jgi:pteridine reductase
MDLKGKTIILTGARRIGQTVAEELAKKGANLAITYRSAKEESEAMCTACIAAGVRAVPFMVDMTKEEDIKKLITDVKKEFGSIDGLVHMAANYPRTNWKDVKPEDFDTEMQVIGKSAFMLGQLASKEMKDGRIVFFSDWAANRAPYKEYAPYLIAKGAIDTITRVLAVELAPNITVNAIAPGPILRPPDLTEEEDKIVLERTPLARWGGAEEIAKAVLFFMESDFVTGVILPVDGGRSIA